MTSRCCESMDTFLIRKIPLKSIFQATSSLLFGLAVTIVLSICVVTSHARVSAGFALRFDGLFPLYSFCLYLRKLIGDQMVPFYFFPKDLNITIKRCYYTLSFVYLCNIWKELFLYATFAFHRNSILPNKLSK